MDQDRKVFFFSQDVTILTIDFDKWNLLEGPAWPSLQQILAGLFGAEHVRCILAKSDDLHWHVHDPDLRLSLPDAS